MSSVTISKNDSPAYLLLAFAAIVAGIRSVGGLKSGYPVTVPTPTLMAQADVLIVGNSTSSVDN